MNIDGSFSYAEHANDAKDNGTRFLQNILQYMFDANCSGTLNFDKHLRFLLTLLTFVSK